MGSPSRLRSRGKFRAFLFLSVAALFIALAACPSSAEPPAGYYDATQDKSGGELKQALHTIIRGHTVIPYASLMQPLREIWRDPDQPDRIRLVYSSTSISANATSWNREHLWPRVRGNADQAGPDDSDLFHVVPTDIEVNAERGNLPFDFSNPADPAYRIPAHSFAPQASRDSDSWQPAPDERGDIARALFYMDVRYNGSEPNTTDLELVSLPPSGPQMGNLNTLLLWHAEDPPDDAERARNDLIHSRYQGNRNPFIDHPEFAAAIWGNGNPGDPLNNPLARAETLSATASERPASPGRFRISLNQFAGPGGVVVRFEISGTASPAEFALAGEGVSYDPATGRGSARIEPGFSRTVLELVPVDDGEPEPAETVILQLTDGDGCDITPDDSSRATVTIRDGPGLPIRWDFEEGLPFPSPLPSNLGEGSISFAGWTGTLNSFGGNSGQSLALVGTNGNGSWIDLRLSMRGWRGLVLNFRTRGTSTGYTTGLWAFSTNGADFTTLPGVNTATTGTTFAARRVDFSAYPQLNNAESVTLRYTLSGASGSAPNNRLDEMTLTATTFDGSAEAIDVVIFAQQPAAKEQGPVAGVFGILLGQPAGENGLAVRFALSGTATHPADYTVAGADSFDSATRTGVLFFPAWADTATLSIVPVADALAEPPETVVLTLLPPETADAYTYAEGASAVVVISDLPNDDFADATTIPGFSVNATGMNLGATRETGEPWHLGGVVSNGGRSVWWSWTAPGTGQATIHTHGSNFDTVLAVYRGNGLATLSRVVWNDDSGGSLTSQVTLSALQGQTYFIAVDGYGLSSGNISLSLAMAGSDSGPEVSLYPSTATTLRERGPMNGAVWIGLSPTPTQALTIALRLAGTATPGADYEVPETRSGDLVFVEIPAGTEWQLLNFFTLTDSDPAEFEESILVAIEPGTGYSASATHHSVALRLLDDTPYSPEWASRFAGFHGPLAGLLEDPDGDGRPNLLEFLLDADPLRADSGGLHIETRPLVDPIDGLEKPYAVLIHERRSDASGISVVIESTARLDLPDWQPDTLWLETTPIPGTHRERITHRSATPLETTPRFFRLKATAP